MNLFKSFLSKVLFPVAYLKSLVEFKRHPLTILSREQTYELLRGGCSFSRFGDGELNICLGRASIDFQKIDRNLASEMRAILTTDTNAARGFLVGLVPMLTTFRGCTVHNRFFWSTFNFTRRERIISMLYNRSDGQHYADSLCFRAGLSIYRHYPIEKFYDDIEQINKIWEQKRILVVEGPECKLGIGSDILYSAETVKRIIVPAYNAYDKADDIFNAVITYHDFDIVLLVCGPTASILSYRLYNAGYQAIDFGQMQNSYIELANNANGFHHTVMTPQDYDKQIIMKID